MGREIKRVPPDFDWPHNKPWQGYLMPDALREPACPDCERGYSRHGEWLFALWYGYVPFDPAWTGSTPLTAATPAVRAFAERNVTHSPGFYGDGEASIVREARRLARLWNGQWSHHLAQEDVDALVAGGRLMDFTHRWTPETRWQPIIPTPAPSAADVNTWSLGGMGHDSINAGLVIEARCERAGQPLTCGTCDGHAAIEAYSGQRAAAEAWEPTEPPTGDGWQVWETVSEGSPISPVFVDREGLIAWLMSPAYNFGASRPLTHDQADAFVSAAWAPTMVSSPATGLVSGDAAMAP